MNIIVVGGSAGSLVVVLKMLPLLDKCWDVSVVLIFHRKDNDDGTLLNILSHRAPFEVKEIEDKEPIRAQVIYVAPADYHVLIEKDKSFSLDYSEKIHYCRPSIDVTLDSAAEAFGQSTIGVLLSGANADGVEGLKTVHRMGGVVAVQDPTSAEVPYMPAKAVESVPVDLIVAGDNVESFIQQLPEYLTNL